MYIVVILIIILVLISYLKKETFTNSKNIILLTQFYRPKWNFRFNEIKQCLLNNLKNKYISQIILFCEEDFNFNEIFRDHLDINLNKIKKVPLQRLSFKQAFNYSNKYYPNHIKILSNSDIYFDNSLKNLDTLNLNRLFLSLTRINETKNGNKFMKLEPTGKFSQDSWIWSGKINIKETDDYKKDGILLGIWGCDNRINYIVNKSNYNIKNYCNLIKSYHKHFYDNHRNDVNKYGKKYKKPYYYPEIEN